MSQRVTVGYRSVRRARKAASDAGGASVEASNIASTPGNTASGPVKAVGDRHHLVSRLYNPSIQLKPTLRQHHRSQLLDELHIRGFEIALLDRTQTLLGRRTRACLPGIRRGDELVIANRLQGPGIRE